MAEMRSVQVGDIRLAYRESGPVSAAPVIVLPALGEDSRDCWDEVASALSQMYHVYAVDLRGHGRSDWPGQYSGSGAHFVKDTACFRIRNVTSSHFTQIGQRAGPSCRRRGPAP
jgi:pimeloyl-ACP methyl ester carboxylesterase